MYGMDRENAVKFTLFFPPFNWIDFPFLRKLTPITIIIHFILLYIVLEGVYLFNIVYVSTNVPVAT